MKDLSILTLFGNVSLLCCNWGKNKTNKAATVSDSGAVVCGNYPHRHVGNNLHERGCGG
jgi:hypothetical protein